MDTEKDFATERKGVVSKIAPLLYYSWGEGCDGWNFVDQPFLSIKQERMPPGTSELKHYHQYANQFFFILTGGASFEIEGTVIEVNRGEGIFVEAGTKHCISNKNTEDLEFILCSQPSTKNDRVNCP